MRVARNPANGEDAQPLSGAASTKKIPIFDIAFMAPPPTEGCHCVTAVSG
jgi:hypothetical protein